MHKYNESYFQSCYMDYRLQNPAYKIAWYEKVLHQWVEEKKSSPRILDAGCGPGLLLDALPASWKRHGADPAHDVLKKNLQMIPDVHFCGGCIEHLPFSPCFDVVTAFDVLEHTDNLDAVAREVAAVLLPDGIFIFVVPVIDGPAGLLVRLLDKDPTHRHLLPRHDWIEWASGHFKVLWWCGITRYLFFKRWYLHLPTKVGRDFTPAILVVARKNRATSAFTTITDSAGARHGSS